MFRLLIVIFTLFSAAIASAYTFKDLRRVYYHDVADNNSIYIEELMRDLSLGLVSLDEEGNVIPAIASTWKVRNFGRKWIFRIREDAKWSNGVQITAYDFVNSFKNLISSTANLGYIQDLTIIEGVSEYLLDNETLKPLGVKAIDERTISFNLSRTSANFLYILSQPWMAPVYGIDNSNNDYGNWSYNIKDKYKVSSGAFFVEKVTTGGDKILELLLRKNNHFFDVNDIDFDTVEWHLINSFDKEKFIKDSSRYFDIISMDEKYIDKQIIEQSQYYGLQYKAIGSKLIILMFNKNSDIWQKNTHEKLWYVAKNLNKFINGDKEIITAIYNINSDINVDDEYIEFFISDDEKSIEVAKQLENYWQRYVNNIDINVEQMDNRKTLSNLIANHGDVWLIKRKFNYVDSLDYYSYWQSDSIFNYMKWKNISYDVLMHDLSMNLISAETRKAMLKQLDNILYENMVAIPIKEEKSRGVFWKNSYITPTQNAIVWESRYIKKQAFYKK